MAYKYVQYENGKFQTTDEGGGGGSLSYSTTEHEVGTWIDGSTIYEITIDLNGGLLYNNIWNNWYIDGSYIDKIINTECIMHIMDDDTVMQFSAPFYIRIQNGYMLFMVSDPSSAYSFYYTDYLTIRYTKVTTSS
jgi:hypothetical protein